MNDQLPAVEFREVNRDTLDDFVELFESRGGPKGCWCMVWRATLGEARKRDGASRKAAFIGRVQRGVPVGILGYIDGKPVAWCSIAPRSTFRGLGGPVEGPGERVWSLTCFFVRREHRGKGMTSRMIQAAVEHARRGGATVVEAYPVDADSPSYRFMGFVPVFEQAGFEEVGRAGSRRHLMRLGADSP